MWHFDMVLSIFGVAYGVEYLRCGTCQYGEEYLGCVRYGTCRYGVEYLGCVRYGTC